MRKVALMYPKGTCKHSTFHFRGGDCLHEPETLLDELKKATEIYNKTKKLLEEAQKEYNETQAELDDLDDCIVKMASNMGQDSLETTEHAQLKSRIKELQEEIEKVESEIKEVSKPITPFEFNSLVDEHASYIPDLRDLSHSLYTNKDNAKNMKREIGQILISDEFSESVESLIEHHVAVECRNRLRSQLNEKTNSIYQMKSNDAGKIVSIDDPELMSLFETQQSLAEDLLESDLQLNLAKIHRLILIKMEIDRISEMNEFLTLMEEDGVNKDEVWQNCMGEEEEEENNEEEVNESSSGSGTHSPLNEKKEQNENDEKNQTEPVIASESTPDSTTVSVNNSSPKSPTPEQESANSN